ncbi:hypothetical protein AB1Y20_018902 [Prymnesium parvum]|uniref:Uncharacterized protein n=1 Tax=Prymnesium parvum TaxID=97485 RepID=A0AB34JSM2_PRYPA
MSSPAPVTDGECWPIIAWKSQSIQIQDGQIKAWERDWPVVQAIFKSKTEANLRSCLNGLEAVEETAEVAAVEDLGAAEETVEGAVVEDSGAAEETVEGVVVEDSGAAEETVEGAAVEDLGAAQEAARGHQLVEVEAVEN